MASGAPRKPVIALTTGEPAGIGPEVAIRAAWALREEATCVLLGDAAYLAMLAGDIDPAIRIAATSQQALRNGGLPHFGADVIAAVDCPLNAHVQAGVLDPRNARAVLQILDVAIDGTLSGQFDAIATAPLQKSVINDAGVPFSGHTEYLADRTGTRQVVMMLAGATEHCGMLRVALATTHLPLRGVPNAISRDGLLDVLRIVHADLRDKFGLAAPRILVAGLNPHAGEGGHLGREEIEHIAPAIAQAKQEGMDVSGPYPADTLFQPKYLRDADCVLAMYHDQGLPVLKFATFGHGVNITLGLPLIRTSVDHGTALDLARLGVGQADCASMMEAIRSAAQMVTQRAQPQLKTP
ncbi:MAG TPA: 4-hydroxythreonine-4-phosphate dehydrogenase PdxA [Burkholderiaceae bacterium]